MQNIVDNAYLCYFKNITGMLPNFFITVLKRVSFYEVNHHYPITSFLNTQSSDNVGVNAYCKCCSDLPKLTMKQLKYICIRLTKPKITRWICQF